MNRLTVVKGIQLQMLNRDDKFEAGNGNASSIVGQVGQTIEAGLPLESGLRALAEQTGSGRTKRALIKLSNCLEQGMPLVEAIRETGAGLPMQMQALIEAGADSGQMGVVLRYYVDQCQRTASLKSGLMLELSYPLFLIWFSFLICGGFVVNVAPFAIGLLSEFNIELPWFTLTIIHVSAAVVGFGWQVQLLLMVGSAAMIFFGVYYGMSHQGQRWLTSIPVLGRVFQLAALANFCEILAGLTEAQLPFVKAIRFAGKASDDGWLDIKCGKIAKEIEQGTSPSNAASLSGLPNTICQVFRDVSSEQKMAGALRGLSNIYAAECRAVSQWVTSLVTQSTVTFVVCFLATFFLGLLIPILTLVRDFI